MRKKQKPEPATCLLTHELLGLEAPRRNEDTLLCPSCGKKKLGVNFSKDTFQCFSCGVKGSAISYWALQRGLSPSDTKAAARDYYAFASEAPKAKQAPKKAKPALPKSAESRLAGVATRDKTYRALLELLSLSPKHRADLVRRGLSEEAIQIGGYKSSPALCFAKIARSLLEKGCVLDGVPGFYKDKNGQWTFLALGSGYFIPQRDGRGRIQGLQIRLDATGKNQKRYLTVSTPDRDCGARALASCHMARGESIEDILITEGPLKADIIRFFTGYTVLGIQGVNCIATLLHALSELKDAGCRKVTIAFDMDFYDNPNVAKALATLKKELAAMRMPFSTLLWDPSQKGLDDWLLANLSCETKEK